MSVRASTAITHATAISASAHRNTAQAPIATSSTVHAPASARAITPALRCRTSQQVERAVWSVRAFALVAGWGSLDSFHSLHPPRRGWRPLAVTTRLTCVYTGESSHRLAHEACSVHRPGHRRFVKRPARIQAPRVDAPSPCRACRYTAACVKSIFSRMPEAEARVCCCSCLDELP